MKMEIRKIQQKTKTAEELEKIYEYGLPGYLQHDLDAYKEGLKNCSDLLDCLWGGIVRQHKHCTD